MNTLTSVAAGSLYRWRVRRSTLLWVLFGVITAIADASIEMFAGGNTSATLAIFATGGMLITLLQTTLEGSRGFSKNDYISNDLLEYGKRSRVLYGNILCFGAIGAINSLIQTLCNLSFFVIVFLINPESTFQNMVTIDFGHLSVAFLLFAVTGIFVGVLGGGIGVSLRSSAVAILATLAVYFVIDAILHTLAATKNIPTWLVAIAPSEAITQVTAVSLDSATALTSLFLWAVALTLVSWLSFRAYKP